MARSNWSLRTSSSRQTDADAMAEISRVRRYVGDETAAGALAGAQELREGKLVADDVVEPSGEEIESWPRRVPVGPEFRSLVYGLDVGRVFAAVDGADPLAREGLAPNCFRSASFPPDERGGTR